MNSYDQVRYASQPVAEAQCRRLETVAALFHLSPVPPASASVLELGCGTGENLVAQALEHPSARFLGCDASTTAIAAGRELIKALGLENIELRQQDLCDVDADWGKFDYILCHGVFSWVEPEVRRRILDIFRHHLAPQGLAYLSYNALPGWHLRQPVRDLVCQHAQGIEDPRQAIAAALDILALSTETHPADTPFGMVLRDEYARLSHSQERHLYHEMLAEHVQPFYFREILEQFNHADLQYLGAAEPAEMFTCDLPAKARVLLEGMPFLLRQQYLDHLRGSTFRCSVLCRAENVIDRRPDPAILQPFAMGLAGDTRLESLHAVEEHQELPASDKSEGVRLVIGTCAIPCTDPLTLAALSYLDERRPEYVTMHDLQQSALHRLGRRPEELRTSSGDGTDRLLRFLLDAVTAGAIDATLSAPRITSRITERPIVGPLARLQAKGGRAVTNQRQEVVELSILSRFVAGLSDGSRDHHQLASLVRQELQSGRISLYSWEKPDDPERLVQSILSHFSRSALLIA